MPDIYQTPIIGQTFNDLNITRLDTSVNSPNYFGIHNFNSTITLGYNSFKVRPNLDTLESDTDIRVSAFDFEENPIEVFFPDVDFGNNDKIVCLVVTEDTVLGKGVITIAGTLKGTTDAIVWQSEVLIDKTTSNVNPIVYEVEPLINHTELTKQKRRESFVEGGTSLLFITHSGHLDPGDDRIITPGSTVFLDVRANGESFAHSDGFNFSPNMVGGTMTVTIPEASLPLYNKYYSLDDTNEIEVLIKNFLANGAVRINSITRDIVGLEDDHKYFSFTDADYAIKSPKELQLITTTGTQTYLLLELLKAQPVSGQAYFIETSYKHLGTSDSSLIDKQIIVPNEFLIDSSSLSFEKTIGTFTSASILDRYWEVGSVNATTLDIPQKWDEVTETFKTSKILMETGDEIFTTLPLTFEPDSPIGPAAVIGSDILDYSAENSYIIFTPTRLNYKNSEFDWKVSSYFKNYYTYSEYDIEITAYSVKNAGSGNKDPVLELYMVGDGFISNNTFDTGTSAGEVVGTLITSLTSTGDGTLYEDTTYRFSARVSGDGHPLVVVRSGLWYISNISIKPYARPGTTANHTYIYVPIPEDLLFTSVDLQFDMLNKVNVGIDFVPEEV